MDGVCICDDAVRLWSAIECPRDQPDGVHAVCPQMFLKPVAPHVAAAAEGKSIDSDLLVSGLERWVDACDVVIVEGAGGWLSPISDDRYVADVAHAIGYPVLIVSANRLGTINQTLQTELAVQTKVGKEKVAGIVLNEVEQASSDASRSSNAAEVKRRVQSPLWATVRHGQSTLPDDVDWLKLFGPGA